ncbi:hypothetical protein BGZ83_005646 [Gryganskiella cystojenkinii]|nr:hypothetical protein BGZ83_005646 [Gryganskiella cystojenkinii]
MSSTQIPSESLIERIISISLLVDLVARHLQPRYIYNTILVSKTFHAAFLEHRWRTIYGYFDDPHSPRPGNYFPKTPSQETKTALMKYGSVFVRHLIVHYDSEQLYELVWGQHQTNHERSCTRLRTLHQVAWGRPKNLNLRLHWDDYEDREEFEHEGDENHRGDQGFSVSPHDKLHFNGVFFLGMAESSRFTLRTLKLEGYRNSPNNSRSLSVRLQRLLSMLEQLEVLMLTQMPMEDVINTFLHLPETVQELSMQAWLPFDRSGEIVDFEQDWARYQRHSRRQRRGEGLITPEESRRLRNLEPVTVQSLLENMENKCRLRKLSLVQTCECHPMWITYEILRHCPNLTAFLPPQIWSCENTYEFLEVLKQSRSSLGLLQHLDLKDFAGTDSECAQLLDDLLGPSVLSSSLPQPRPNHHQQPQFYAAKGAIAANGHLGHIANINSSPRGGLRSLSLGYKNSYDVHFTRALAEHYSTLERVSLACGGEVFSSYEILNLLESIPRLEIFIVMETADKNMYHCPVSLVDCLDFVQSGECLSDGSDDDGVNSNGLDGQFRGDSEASELTATKAKVSSPSGSTAASSPPGPLATTIPLTLKKSDSPWMCTSTLRVLSLCFTINMDMIRQKKHELLSIYSEVYRTLGQLLALEDLAIGFSAPTDAAATVQDHDNDGDTASDFGRSLLDHDAPSLTAIRSSDSGQATTTGTGEVTDSTGDPVVYAEEQTTKKLVTELNCSLEQGLGQMSGLKRLRRLNVRELKKRVIGRVEVLWMEEHWPSLESVPGLKVLEWDFSEDELQRLSRKFVVSPSESNYNRNEEYDYYYR